MSHPGQASVDKVVTDTLPPVGWRIALAATFLGLSICSFVTGGAILASNLSSSIKGAAALLIFPMPELLDLTAVAIVGKPGFLYLKKKVLGFFKPYVAPLAPPDEVSATRYRIGLVLFAAPLAFGWLAPYFGHNIPGFMMHGLWFHVLGDVLFLASFFVVGGNFWDKFRALFIRDAKVVLP